MKLLHCTVLQPGPLEDGRSARGWQTQAHTATSVSRRVGRARFHAQNRLRLGAGESAAGSKLRARRRPTRSLRCRGQPGGPAKMESERKIMVVVG